MASPIETTSPGNAAAEPAPHPRRFDPYRALSQEERGRQLEAYRRLLERRDGAMDFEGGTLSRREAYFRELQRKPVRWKGSLDRDAFFQHLRRTGRPALDARTLWLVAAAKANESESFGVDGEVARFRRRGIANVDPREIYVLMEERYHSRILVEACRTAGIDLEIQKPPRLMRALIGLMQYFPTSLRYVFILNGELMGAVLFKILLDRSDVFADEREVHERLRSLIREIWVDETFHVLYCRARLGPAAVRLARALLPILSVFYTAVVPQLCQLGCGRRDLLASARRGIEIPSEADWPEPEPLRQAENS